MVTMANFETMIRVNLCVVLHAMRLQWQKPHSSIILLELVDVLHRRFFA